MQHRRLRSCIFALALFGTMLRVAGGETFPRSRPNIIFILPDQWRAQAFGFAGDPNVHTPNLDRLAGESVNFTHAIAAVPVCCPTRASLMTGQRPLTHGVFLNDVPLESTAVTLGTVLGGAGYDTGYIGKWHLNGGDRMAFIPRERRFGFDYWKASECTHDYLRSFYYAADEPTKLQWPGYDASAQTADAARYIRTHAHANKPFFLFLAWGPPHSPYESAPEKYRALYAREKIVLRDNVPSVTRSTARTMLANYYAHCSALDDCLAQLRSALAESGLANDTLIVFSSDHGDMLGSHGGRDKQQPYDESIRVPLLLHWPAGLGTAPRQRDAIVSSEDVMPTLLGLCGIPIPATVEGHDYSAYARGAQPLRTEDAKLISCIAPFGEWSRKAGGREYRGIRTARYTYVRDLNGPWLLFDNEADPYQGSNLANRPEHTALQAELEALLQRKLAETHDQFLPGDDYIRQWGYRVDKNGTVPYAE